MQHDIDPMIINRGPSLTTEPLFDPVWITSRDHLDHYQQIRDATPWYWVFFGGKYDVPADFPSIEIGSRRFPLVYFSSGAVTIAKNLVTYAARSYSSSGVDKQRRNLKTSLTFSMDNAERPKLRRFRAGGSPSYYSINWIELTLPGRSLLLCAGGSGPGMGRVRRRTDMLFNSLLAWAGDQP